MNFSFARLDQANLTGAHFIDSLFKKNYFGVEILDGVRFSYCHFESVEISQTMILASRIENCQFHGSKFINVEMDRAVIWEVCFFNSIFDLQLASTTVADCSFKNVEFVNSSASDCLFVFE